MEKPIIRLEESQLHQIVLETLGEILYNSEPREEQQEDVRDVFMHTVHTGRPMESDKEPGNTNGGDTFTSTTQFANPLSKRYKDDADEIQDGMAYDRQRQMQAESEKCYP